MSKHIHFLLIHAFKCEELMDKLEKVNSGAHLGFYKQKSMIQACEWQREYDLRNLNTQYIVDKDRVQRMSFAMFKVRVNLPNAG